mmetsp:Transcript_30003/g.95809  ORF Transcript_30003/g.95809 Transcript_30003/m.95809 type:complete len:250 (+) Transcript_30003:45-794(+)
MPPTQQEAEAAIRTLIEYMGDDPNREGLKSSPRRSAKALRFLTAGYEVDVEALASQALFSVGESSDEELEEDHAANGAAASGAAANGTSSDGVAANGTSAENGTPGVSSVVPVPRPMQGSGLVEVSGIEIYSLCEHHLLPFFGTCRIAYLPSRKVVGLSKLARVANAFARRLQIQERLTQQIAESLWKVLQPRGIRVVLECTHMCMSMRGVQQPRAVTATRTELGWLPPEPGAYNRGWEQVGCPCGARH